MKRLSRIVYLFVVAAVTAFIAGFAIFYAAEASSPTDVASGRVLDRISGDRETCSGQGLRRRCRTFPIYSVIGERQDGTAWIVVGEGPYDAMGGERGEISVTTSGLTGRVVGLAGIDETWEQPSSRYATLGFVGLGFWSLLLAAYEYKRRSGGWAMGRFNRVESLVAIPGVILGIVLVAVVTFGKQWGLDVETSDLEESTFIADPFNYSIVQSETEDNGPGLAINETFDAASTPHAVVGQDHLIDEVRAAWLAADDVLAIPLLREGSPTGTLGLVTFVIEQPSETFETIDCPSSLLSFPAGVGQADVFGGFICFDRAAEGGTFLVLSGSIRVMDLDARPSYQLVDGTVVSPPR